MAKEKLKCNKDMFSYTIMCFNKDIIKKFRLSEQKQSDNTKYMSMILIMQISIMAATA